MVQATNHGEIPLDFTNLAYARRGIQQQEQIFAARVNRLLAIER